MKDIISGIISGAIDGIVDSILKAVKPFKKIFGANVVILPSQIHRNWWHMGKYLDKPAMQVSSGWHVTNKSDKQIRILNVYLKNPKTMGTVLTRKIGSNLHGFEFSIPSNQTSDLAVEFWIYPPSKKDSEAFKSDVIFVDQYGKKVVVKNVNFPYI